MFIAPQSDFEAATLSTAIAAPLRGPSGLTTGTMVETDRGFFDVVHLIEGMKLYTYDGGLVELLSVARPALTGARTLGVRVAPGQLDNDAALILPAAQHVLVETGRFDETVGAPLALARVGALVGLEGFAPSAVRDKELVTLGFAEEEVIYAQSGTLIHCTGQTTRGTAEFYPMLDDSFARAMMADRLG